jgi:hypothetical protein
MVVERKNLKILEQEMEFQLSGKADDDTVLAIGKKFSGICRGQRQRRGSG